MRRKIIRKHQLAGVMQYQPDFNITDSIAKIDAINLSKRFLRNVENNVGKGFNYVMNRWYPHKSVEGGANTIAHGMKLQKSNDSNIQKWVDLVNSQGYLTSQQAEQALDDYVNSYREGAKHIYDSIYGRGTFDKLAPAQQAAAIDIQYNGGLGRFPKFMEALHNDDLEDQIKQSRRYVKTKKGKLSLGRNRHMEQMLRQNSAQIVNPNIQLKDQKPTIYFTR